jgi:hypothetical protein
MEFLSMSESSRMITMVFPHNVQAVWPLCAEMLRPAIDREGKYAAEDIRRLLLTGQAQLWVDWEGGKVLASLVTEFRVFPKGAWLNVWIMGAPKGEADIEAFQDSMFQFAEANGCVGVMLTGRKGWRGFHDRFKAAVKESTIYTCNLKDLKKILGENNYVERRRE